MKKFISLFGLITILACQSKPAENTQTPSTTPEPTAPMVGNDSDEHGCKGSAGYQWSVVKNDCVQVFETGLRLDPQDKALNQTLSAFAIFANSEAEEQGDVEVFVPSTNGSTILKPVKGEEAGAWANDTLKLSQWKGQYLLEKKGKLQYQGHR
jgi:hypothetical protein